MSGSGKTRLGTGRLVRNAAKFFRGALFYAGCASLCLGGAAYAADDDLANMTLEELLNLEVTSVSKKAEKRTNAAAAIYVLTNEDIRRSGAQTIPDALRMVPGLAVAQLDAFKWSVSSRGFGGRFSNKLLVLIDGRSVYTPLFSGVYWEAQDVMLEDVERIEVIRGPGGTLWGANAVNGVINIVTKQAADTQGNVVIGGTGTEETGFTSLRFGGPLREGKGYYRTYGKFLSRGPGATAAGGRADDGGTMVQGGFRIDADLSLIDTLTVQGDAFENRSYSMVNLPVLNALGPVPTKDQSPFIGFNLLTRWNRKVSSDSDFQLQTYFDHYEVEAVTNSVTLDIADVDFQYRHRWDESHETVWGLGARIWQDDLENTDYIVYLPTHRTQDVVNGYIENQIAIRPDLVLTIGSKLEHNSQTGWEVQPSARMAWTPGERHTVWSSISRAVRTPSRAEDDIFLVDSAIPAGVIDPLPALAILIGSDDFDSEELWAFEAGYRTSLAGRSAFDVAGFVNLYDNLRTIEQGAIIPGPLPGFTGLPAHVVLPFYAANNLSATAYGFEAAVDFEVNDRWLIRTHYSLLKLDLDFKPGIIDPNSDKDEGGTPEQQAYLQNSFHLPGRVEVDAYLRYVDQLPSLGINDYVTSDLRVGWHPRENLEVAIVGRNLFDAEHFEFKPRFVNTSPTQVQRSVYGMVKWEF